jgi:hypothetical protein
MNNITDNLNIYHIVPRFDHMIIPTSSTYYPTTPEEHIFRYSGYYSHIGIPHHNDVSNSIISWLKSQTK